MQVKTSFDPPNTATNKKNDVVDSTKMGAKGRPDSIPRPKLSENEIREKIEQHRQKIQDKLTVSDKSKMILKKSKNKEKFEELDETKAPKVSQVGLNNPKDPNTTIKLKNILSAGSFNFSDKERTALEDILKE